MRCASCTLLIERELRKTPGVQDAQVNFAAGKAWVVFDPGVTTADALIQVVQETGYGASFPGETLEIPSRKDEEVSVSRRRFFTGLVLSLPLAFFMVLDFVPGFPGRKVIHPFMGLVSLLCATLIQFVLGMPFYRGLVVSLRLRFLGMDSLIAIGTSVAYGFSLVTYLGHVLSSGFFLFSPGQEIPHLYFETSAFLITFVLLGRWLEKETRRKNLSGY